MAAIYHPSVVTVVPHYDLGSGRDGVNVTHWRTPVTGLNTAQLTAIQTAFDTAWEAQWHVFASSTARYLGSWVIDSGSSLGAQVTNVTYTPKPGQGTDGAVGDQVAALLSLHGVNRYRGGHARLYIPGADTLKVDPGGRNLVPAAIGNIETMMANTGSALAGLSGANGGPLNQVIWHKKWAAAPNTIEDVISFTCQQLLATQRRRLRKVSRHRSH